MAVIIKQAALDPIADLLVTPSAFVDQLNICVTHVWSKQLQSLLEHVRRAQLVLPSVSSGAASFSEAETLEISQTLEEEVAFWSSVESGLASMKEQLQAPGEPHPAVAQTFPQ